MVEDGKTHRKAVGRLIRTGLLEEVGANGSLLAWRRDAETGPMALRITKEGVCTENWIRLDAR
jgi:hypothetical protein